MPPRQPLNKPAERPSSKPPANPLSLQSDLPESDLPRNDASDPPIDMAGMSFGSVDVGRRYAALLAEWSKCRLCPLHATRQHVVIARGSLPCDVLILGQAPGKDDDREGLPFSGRSGRLLISLLNEMLEEHDFTYCFAHTIGCVPWHCGDEEKYRAPTQAEEKHCVPRLASVIELARPRGIVTLGKDVESYLAAQMKSLVLQTTMPQLICNVATPTEILNTGGASTGNDVYRRTRSALRQFVFNKVLKV